MPQFSLYDHNNNDCCADNTLAKLDDYRIHVIAQLIDVPLLRRLDKDSCTNVERRQARAWLKEMAEDAAEEEEEEEEEEVEEEQVSFTKIVFTKQ